MDNHIFRTLTLLSLITVFGACASDKDQKADTSSVFMLSARIVSVAELDRFIGDTAIEGYSYVVEPVGQVRHRLTLVGDKEVCPVAGDQSIVYNLQVERRPMKFAIRQKSDEALMSDLFIVNCSKA